MAREYFLLILVACGTAILNLALMWRLEKIHNQPGHSRQQVLWVEESFSRSSGGLWDRIFSERRMLRYDTDSQSAGISLELALHSDSKNQFVFKSPHPKPIAEPILQRFHYASRNLSLDHSAKQTVENERQSNISATTQKDVYLDDSEPPELTYASVVEDIERMSQLNEYRDTDWLRVLHMPTKGVHSFNETASDLLGNFRHDLPDYRASACKSLHYDIKKLPKTSIIIIFHNEARSTLMRTLHSILERTPKVLLEEILLVDDASTYSWLQEPLDWYIPHIPRVRIIRLKERQGLIRARMRGAEEAKGEVLFFVDAHTEVAVNWLPPLLARIRENRKVLVFPEMDPIKHSHFQYWRADDEYHGAFFWHLEFQYKFIPNEKKMQRKNVTAPIASPVMVGCAHAIDRDYFFETGAYDTDMEIWGGENIEHAFRLWMCGGRVEIMPCSRVGHVFKPYLPYKFTGDSWTVIQRNLIRIAEVWMDEYKQYFYATQPNVAAIDLPSLERRKELRKKLKCKSFDWYMKNVIPEMPIPPLTAKHYGQVSSKLSEGRCLRVNADTHKLETSYCERQEWTEHHFSIDPSGKFTFKNQCIEVDNNQNLLLTNHSKCPKNSWKYKGNKFIQFIDGNNLQLCLNLRGNSEPVVLSSCDTQDKHQWWSFTYNYNFNRTVDIATVVNKTLTPPANALYFGALQNIGSKLCLNPYENQEYAMTSCNGLHSYEKILHYDTDSKLVFKHLCLCKSHNSDLMLVSCAKDRGFKLWTYNEASHWLRVRGADECMKHDPALGEKVLIVPCDSADVYQKWSLGQKV